MTRTVGELAEYLGASLEANSDPSTEVSGVGGIEYCISHRSDVVAFYKIVVHDFIGADYGFFSVCYRHGHGGGGCSLFRLPRENEGVGCKGPGDAGQYPAACGAVFDDWGYLFGIFGKTMIESFYVLGFTV